MKGPSDTTITADAVKLSGDVEIPDELRVEITALQIATEHGLSVKTDDDLREAESVRTRAKKVIAAVEQIYATEKANRFAAHKAIVAEEKFMLGAPSKAIALCESAMKPYLLKREQEREAERRRLELAAQREAEERRAREAEEARLESERLAAIARREAEERAQREREEAERQAKAVEEEALARYVELEAQGKKDEANAVLQDATQRSSNITTEAEEVATSIVSEGEDIAQRTEAEAQVIVAEIQQAPLERMYVPAPAGPQMDSTGTSSTYKCDRAEAVKPKNKLQLLRYILAEADRENFIPLSWVDHNFKNIDSVAKRGTIFPTEERCGLRVGKDIGLRSKPTPRA